MTSPIWILRVALLLEFFGAVLLSLDLFTQSVRQFIRERFYQIVNIKEFFLRPKYIISVVFILFPISGVIKTVFSALLIVNSEQIREFVINTSYISVWLEIIQYPIINSISSGLLVIWLMSLLYVIYFILLGAQYFLFQFGYTERIPPDKTIDFALNLIVSLVSLILLPELLIQILPIIVMSLAVIIPLGITYLIPFIFIQIGFYIESKSIVTNGPRFTGLVLLMIGFIIQIGYTFAVQ
jgi:hypothetical protein